MSFPDGNGFPRRGRLIVALCLAVWVLPVQASGGEISPSEVYTQVLQIEKEIDLLRSHDQVTGRNPVAPVESEFLPRHTWQKAYVILLKLSVFRRKHGLTGFAPVGLEPDLRLSPRVTWGQTQRVLTELRIIRTYLGIPGEVSPPTPVQGKRPIDVFNRLNQIAYDLDVLNGEPISPSYVYSEAMRINEDVNEILRRTNTADTAFPPPRQPDAQPQDALAATFTLMEEIQRLQRRLGSETVDFNAFRKTSGAVSADVLNMTTLCSAEIQIVKAKLGMTHVMTPAAEYSEGKTPVEVLQLLGYLSNRLRLITLQ